MKKVLVIGGSYFAGRVFVEELAKEKDVEIHVFNRGRVPLRMAGVNEIVGDREDVAQIKRGIPGQEWDAVVDFCGYEPLQIRKMIGNVPGKIKQYIYISTTTVYEKSANFPVAEDAPKLSGPQRELGAAADYGYDKWRSECALREECERSAIAYTCLRPAIIYGYYNYAPRETYFFDLLRKREPIVIPDNEPALFSFIWVVDMARMIIGCIGESRAYNQAFNLASDELVSYPRIVEVLGEITGKNLEPVRMPVAEIERARIPLPFPLDEHLVYSGAKIQRLLNFGYTPFKIGMRGALKYYLTLQKQRQALLASQT